MKNAFTLFSLILIGNIFLADSFAFAKKSNEKNIHVMASEGDLKGLQKVISKNTDVNKTDDAGGTMLMAAANSGHENVINFLVKRKAQLNLRSKEGYTALYYAIINEQSAVAKILIDSGADVASINEGDDSALIAAVTVNDTKLIKDLLKKHPELLNKGNKDKNTPLHEAIRNGSQETLTLILNAGADKSLKDDQGRNALDLAKFEKNKFAEKLLSK